MRVSKFGVLMIAGMMLLTLASSGGAAVLTVSGPVSGNVLGPQSTSNPCIIAATQCQQPAGFAFNNFVSSGAIPTYNESQSYTVENLRQFVGNVFSVAIDVNTTNAAGEILDSFTLKNGATTLFQYTGGFNIGSLSSNGNGFA